MSGAQNDHFGTTSETGTCWTCVSSAYQCSDLLGRCYGWCVQKVAPPTLHSALSTNNFDIQLWRLLSSLCYFVIGSSNQLVKWTASRQPTKECFILGGTSSFCEFAHLARETGPETFQAIDYLGCNPTPVNIQLKRSCSNPAHQQIMAWCLNLPYIQPRGLAEATEGRWTRSPPCCNRFRCPGMLMPRPSSSFMQWR